MGIIEFFRWLGLEIIKVATRNLTFCAIIITAFVYIVVLASKPFISVSGNLLIFDLPSFQSCTITFKNPVTVLKYDVSRGHFEQLGVVPEISINSVKVGRNLSVLTVVNNDSQQNSGTNINQGYHVAIVNGSSLSSDIETIATNNVAIDLKFFLTNNLKSKGEIFRCRYIRKDLSTIITFLNDPVSNWILAIMFFGISALSLMLVKMEWKAIFFTENQFKNSLIKSLKISDINNPEECKRAFAEYAARWYGLHNWFRFLQALGPAVGFILTVSSLIAALHPALHATNDLDAFINGIHVAMISTFLGLLLRIVALEASRVNDVLLTHAEIYLGDGDK